MKQSILFVMSTAHLFTLSVLLLEQSTFAYNSSYWTNNETYSVQEGLQGPSENETKLASYWNTPFKKICIGMTVKRNTKWMAIDYEASSLYSVIADGQYRRTSAGREAWKSLIAGSVLQQNCNSEGFNLYCMHNSTFKLYTRLGFAASSKNNCETCDSWVGFGVRHFGCSKKDCFMACGAKKAFGNNRVDISAFGYILVH